MNYITEDGHLFDIEDFEAYAIYKVDILIKEGYSDNDIISYDDFLNWKVFVSKLLKRIKG